MKTIGFIGACDTADLTLFIAKLLQKMDKKVMIIDTSAIQKMKYIAPTISPSKTYVTEFEGIDIAVGFNDYNAIKVYLGMPQHAVFDYDYILLDIDSPEAFISFDLKSATKNYFITNFGIYPLKRGVEILSAIEEPIPMKKILFSKKATREEEDYLNYLTMGSKVIFDKEKIYFPFEQGDQTIIMENQRVSKVKIKGLSKSYKAGLMYLAMELIEEEEFNNLEKVFKQLEKGV